MDNKYKSALRLTGYSGDGFVCFEDPYNPLMVRIESVSLDGRVTLAFSNNTFECWREKVYQRRLKETA